LKIREVPGACVDSFGSEPDQETGAPGIFVRAGGSHLQEIGPRGIGVDENVRLHGNDALGCCRDRA
jgi:hypothetical protein